MKALIDAFWRAVAYCLHPQVIALSLLPLLIGSGLAVGAAWLYWEAAVAGVRATLESWSLLDAAMRWLETFTGASWRAVLAPVIVVALAVPVIVVMSVLLVATLMMPAIVRLVAARRFSSLERRHGAGFVASALWSLVCTLVALLALVVTMPLWLIPPLVLVLPPLIWGWMTYRVMAFDVLADHASAAERRELMRRHRGQLLGIGIIAGYLGAAPTLLWAVSAATLVFAPLLVAVSVWLYTLVFAFGALWFAHFCLAALSELRAENALVPVASPGAPGITAPATGQVIDITPKALPPAPPNPSAP
jgi:Etoposide-induced protein 2.4 (EI24)